MASENLIGSWHKELNSLCHAPIRFSIDISLQKFWSPKIWSLYSRRIYSSFSSWLARSDTTYIIHHESRITTVSFFFLRLSFYFDPCIWAICPDLPARLHDSSRLITSFQCCYIRLIFQVWYLISGTSDLYVSGLGIWSPPEIWTWCQISGTYKYRCPRDARFRGEMTLLRTVDLS